jgi:hypothetical protein
MHLRPATRVFLSALLLAAAADAEIIFAVTQDNRLISFDSMNPAMLSSNVAITSLQAGESIVGIDVRPADRMLYAVGSSSRVYTVNTGTGAATQVGGVLSVPLMGDYFGVDFNPQADRLRVISDADQNLRINPDTAVVATNISPAGDGMLAYGAMDLNFGSDPFAIAAAYSNNVANASSTTLFVVDAANDVLATQAPPNNGTLNTTAALTVNLPNTSGFDISGLTGIAYLASGNNLWTVPVTGAQAGQAVLVGSIGVGTPLNVTDIAAAPIPEPATFVLMSAGLLGAGMLRRFRK